MPLSQNQKALKDITKECLKGIMSSMNLVILVSKICLFVTTQLGVHKMTETAQKDIKTMSLDQIHQMTMQAF